MIYELPQQACQQIVDLLLLLPLKVAVDVRSSNTDIVSISFVKVVNQNRRKNRLPSPWNARAEQRLSPRLQPCLICLGVQEPSACPGLLSLKEMALMGTIVRWRDPVQNVLTILLILAELYLVDVLFGQPRDIAFA